MSIIGLGDEICERFKCEVGLGQSEEDDIGFRRGAEYEFVISGIGRTDVACL